MKLVSLDSSNSDIIFEKNSITCLNINSLVGRKFDEEKLKQKIETLLISSSSINLCNLASLCYKLKIKYDSFECLELLEVIINYLKQTHNIEFIQNNIENKLETDLKPFSKVFKIDETNSIIYINRIFKEKLNFIGFADSQMITLLGQVKNIEKYIPQDLLVNVGLENELTLTTYNYIKELLN